MNKAFKIIISISISYLLLFQMTSLGLLHETFSMRAYAVDEDSFSNNIDNLGDVDSDGEINSMDSLLILEYVTSFIQLNDEKLLAADVNMDGTVNSEDSFWIIYRSIGIIDDFNHSLSEMFDGEIVPGFKITVSETDNSVTAVVNLIQGSLLFGNFKIETNEKLNCEAIKMTSEFKKIRNELEEDGFTSFFLANKNSCCAALSLGKPISQPIPCFNLVFSKSEPFVLCSEDLKLAVSDIKGCDVNDSSIISITYEYNSEHKYELIGTTQPDCTHYGYSLYKCTDCGNEYKTDLILASGHNREKLINQVPATCVHSGYSLYKCSTCGKEYKTDWVEATGHTKGEMLHQFPATCVQSGYSVYKCSVCGKEFETDWVDSLDHSYSFITTAPPTCVDKGYDKYECSVCGSIKKENYVQHTGHHFENEICTACGMNVDDAIIDYSSSRSSKTYTISKPGAKRIMITFSNDSAMFPSEKGNDQIFEVYDKDNKWVYGLTYDRSMPGDIVIVEGDTLTIKTYEGDFALSEVKAFYSDCTEHNNTVLKKQCAETCADYGYSGDLYCMDCGKLIEKGQYVPLHFSTRETVETIGANCLNHEGYTIYHCTKCGSYYKDDFTWNDEHVKGELLEKAEPTCTRDGYSIYRCLVCGKEFYTDWKYSNGHTGTLIEKFDSSCTEVGYRLYHCSVCGQNYTYEDGDFPIGHHYIDGKCTRCNSSTPFMETHTVIITKANKSETIEFTPQSSGIYYFYSHAGQYLDTKAELYDSEMNLIEENDDYYVQGGDFQISYNLICGNTYYLTTSFYSDEQYGSYDVVISDEFLSGHNFAFVERVAPGCRSDGCDIFKCDICGKSYFCNYTDSIGGTHNYENGVCTKCGENQGITAVSNSSAIIDEENKLIYGLELKLNSDVLFNKYVHFSDDLYYDCYDWNLGTSSVVNLYSLDTDDLYATYTIVIFGDVNSDGVYDGQDAFIVNCLANGMLTREQVGEAKWMAADCNHDGEINATDVALLEQAGLLLTNVDQTASQDELMQSDSYIEYLNLIDQNPTPEEEIVKEPIIEQPTEKSFLQKVVDLIKMVITFIYSLIVK